MKTLNLVFLFTILLTTKSHAQSSVYLPPLLSVKLGMISNSLSEGEDGLVVTDGSNGNSFEPFSGSASTISLGVQFEDFISLKKSYFIRGEASALGGDTKQYSFGVGMNYYFGEIASRAVIEDRGFKITIRPKMRYYAGGGVGLDYLVYNTISQTKGDFLFGLGAHGGIVYPYNQKISINGELGLNRSIGSIATSIQLRIMLGVTMALGDLK